MQTDSKPKEYYHILSNVFCKFTPEMGLKIDESDWKIICKYGLDNYMYKGKWFIVEATSCGSNQVQLTSRKKFCT